MRRVNKEQRLRVEGMNYALRIVKSKGIDELEKENIKRFLYSERERAEIHYIAEQLKEGGTDE